MVRENQLRDLVARLLMLQPENIAAETSLTILDNSLGEAKLRLGLKRIGMQLPAGPRAVTFGELRDRMSGGPPHEAKRIDPAPTPLSVAPFAGLRVGLDVQDIASLPVAADYWEDAFYRGIFGKPEIAYAVVQTEPRTHFAGFWCAKEALRKCDPAFSQVDPTQTMVAHDEGGRPYFVWKDTSGETRLPHALSISHAAAIAMAVVVDRVVG